MIFIIILGILIGVCATSLFAIGKIEDAEEERYNAELRAVTHFRKLARIDETIKTGQKEGEYTIYTVKKIQEILNKKEVN